MDFWVFEICKALQLIRYSVLFNIKYLKTKTNARELYVLAFFKKNSSIWLLPVFPILFFCILLFSFKSEFFKHFVCTCSTTALILQVSDTGLGHNSSTIWPNLSTKIVSKWQFLLKEEGHKSLLQALLTTCLPISSLTYTSLIQLPNTRSSTNSSLLN